ncbi:MAG: amino acid permease [Bacteroidales bacterium]|nr:amino acid permease [Bacteroidales bacterium]MBN2762049.1 amino acid permease [Bacteroidales bacterium]
MRSLLRRKSVSSILKNEGAGIEGTMLKKDLSVRDLTSLGIAAIIGAGIYSTIGNAATSGGPAVSLLFVMTAIVCGFSALCYAEFASRIPMSGSAYTYAYASFGELVAWIIGWDLIMEYSVGNIAVAISWSDYFSAALNSMGVHMPEFLGMDYRTAWHGFKEGSQMIASGYEINHFSYTIREGYLAWTQAPRIAGLPFIIDLPAVMITFFITWLVFVGIHESKMASNIFVLIKLIILLVVIGVGAFLVKPGNWQPFAPNGFSGMMKGISGVFFAYIGFDAISTTAEECKNPRRDIPRAMIYALGIATVLYIAVSLVLTGMVHYSELGVGDPMAYVFQKFQLTRLSGVIAVSAIVAMTGVLLVFQVGQPRIWMSMSRDGLLPPAFSRIHKRFRTPAFATVLTGIIVAIPTFFVSLTEATDLASIGTIFAFVLVSGGILLIGNDKNNTGKGYRIPYLNSRYYLLPLWVIVLGAALLISYPGKDLFSELITSITRFPSVFVANPPVGIFIIVAVLFSLLSIIKKLSLIPVISVLANLYLMTGLGNHAWMRFGIWLAIGLLIYFLYGYRKSLMNQK